MHRNAIAVYMEFCHILLEGDLPVCSSVLRPCMWFAACVRPQFLLAEILGLRLDICDAEEASLWQAKGCWHAAKPSIC
jgi:hypothetical protein